MRQTLTLFLVVFCNGLLLGQQQYLEITADSEFYVAGQTIYLRILSREVEGNSVSKDKMALTIDLVRPSGTILEQKRVLINDTNYEARFDLPYSLSSGAYTIYAHGTNKFIKSGRITVDVYGNGYLTKDSTLNTTSYKESKHVSPGVNTVSFKMEETYGKKQRVTALLRVLHAHEKGPYLLMVKIYDIQRATRPIVGTTSNLYGYEGSKISISPVNDDPDTRVSFFFVDKGDVDEGYLGQKDQLLQKLKFMEGSGKVWAFQFDSQGNKLGTVDLNINTDSVKYMPMTNNPVSSSNPRLDYMISQARKRVIVNRNYHVRDENFEVSESDFDNPDYSIELSQYEKLPTVRETISAFVPKCRVIKRRGKYELRVVPKETSYRYKGSPLIMINHIPTFDNHIALGLAVDDIESIHLTNSVLSQKDYGIFGMHGVIAFKLKSGVDNPLIDYYQKLPYINGVDVITNKESILASYRQDESRIPDLRALLYWNPQLYTNVFGEIDLEFLTSDVEGQYMIYVEAITPGGEAIHASNTFFVK